MDSRENRFSGIVSIDEQTRPIYLKRDYGKLRKEKVYVRRGSCTDPTKPASPEEIARMGIGAAGAEVELVVEFADTGRDETLGTDISWEAEFCEMPAMETIPDLSPRREHPFYVEVIDPINRPNTDFFRELANFEFARRLFRPVRLFVKNVGQVAVSNVRVELTVLTNIGVMVVDDPPERPKRRVNFLKKTVFRGMRSFHRDPGEVRIDKNNDRFRVEIDCGHLQPGRPVWSDVFYVGKATAGKSFAVRFG